MSFLAKVGAFNADGALSANVVVTGVGFQPKVVIFWNVGSASTGADSFVGANATPGIGIALSGSARWSISNQLREASADSDTDRTQRDDEVLTMLNVSGTVTALLDFISMDADGFTCRVDDAFPFNIRTHYLALGGTDLTDLAVGQFKEPASTGMQDITSVGFEPDMVLFGSVSLANAIGLPSAEGNALMMIGAAVSAAQQAVMFGIDLTGQTTMTTDAYSRSGECITGGTRASGLSRYAALDSFLSNGFRLDWTERSSDTRIFYLALKGGSYRIDNFLTSVTSGATIAESGFGFAPKATMLFSHGRAQDTSDVLTNEYQWNVGAFTSTTERGAQGVLSENNVATSDVERYVEHDVALAQITTAPALVGEVDVQSIDSDGFTLVMDSAASPAAFVWYISFGDTSGAALVKVVNEVEDIGESILRKLGLTRFSNEAENIAETFISKVGKVRVTSEVVNLSESTLKTSGIIQIRNEMIEILEDSHRFLGKLQIHNEAVDISETTLDYRGKFRLINESIETSEDNIRTIGLVRLQSEAINLSEDTARFLGILRMLNEPVNIAEQSIRVMAIVRLLTESLQLPEDLIKIIGILRIHNEITNYSETSLHYLGKIQVLSETINISEDELEFVVSLGLVPVGVRFRAKVNDQRYSAKVNDQRNRKRVIG